MRGEEEMKNTRRVRSKKKREKKTENEKREPKREQFFSSENS